uniref:Uncharacterized protein n=1 Tax=Rhizophora mucronata TaxID=61149 RepID=A0A2P2MZ66_RHIMU
MIEAHFFLKYSFPIYKNSIPLIKLPFISQKPENWKIKTTSIVYPIDQHNFIAIWTNHKFTDRQKETLP